MHMVYMHIPIMFFVAALICFMTRSPSLKDF